MTVPAWLQGLAIASLILGFGSAILIGIDVSRRPQHMAIMNAVWPITALYLGPIVVWWYWTLGRAMPRGSAADHHEHQQKRPFRKAMIVEA